MTSGGLGETLDDGDAHEEGPTYVAESRRGSLKVEGGDRPESCCTRNCCTVTSERNEDMQVSEQGNWNNNGDDGDEGQSKTKKHLTKTMDPEAKKQHKEAKGGTTGVSRSCTRIAPWRCC